MSDHEGTSGAVDDELSLPKATVQKLIAEILPKDILSSKESRDLIIECCVEFIHMISTEANEICEKEAKKTISPEHIVGALKVSFCDRCRRGCSTASVRHLGSNRMSRRLKACSRTTNRPRRYVNGTTSTLPAHCSTRETQDREKKTSKFEASGKSEEELLNEQEKLFAASRARFQAGQ
ncbi:negative cofactor 2 transcription regulator complex subunit ncb2 [Ceratobasidium sp. 394]|nr:negative cofactor 2 transcription regulator complex subunit ncb2 [Ceratobasidium sp. 394]